MSAEHAAGCGLTLAVVAALLPLAAGSAAGGELPGVYGWWRDPEVETVEGEVFSFGRAGDVPLVGDWDGDGVDSVGVRRGKVFFLRSSNTSGPADTTAAFGRVGDTAVVGDWDVDGADTVGVVRGDRLLYRNRNRPGPASGEVTIPDRGTVLLGRRSSVCRSGVGPFTREVRSAIARRADGRRYAAAVYDTRGGCSYVLDDRSMTTASVIKIEVLAALLLAAQAEGRGLTPWERSRAQLMIGISSDRATNEIIAHLGGVGRLRATSRALGLDHTQIEWPRWGLSHTTPTDQVRLVRMLLLGDLGSPVAARYRRLAMSLLTDITPSQRWGVRAGVPRRWAVAHKNGFFGSSSYGYRANSVGFVADPAGGGYAIAIFTDGNAGLADGVPLVRFIARAVSDELTR